MSLKNCTISVFGLGLIGGSLAWKLRRDGLVQDVAGWSRNPETVRRAMEAGMIGRGCVSAEECAALGDVLVLAVPIRSMEEVSLKIRSAARPDVRAVLTLRARKQTWVGNLPRSGDAATQGSTPWRERSGAAWRTRILIFSVKQSAPSFPSKPPILP